MNYFLPHSALDHLFDDLRQQGYTCYGPQVQNNAIVYAELHHAQQLPWGIQDQQEPGKYRLRQTDSATAFAWANGPQASKPLLFKPKESLWRVERDAQGKLSFQAIPPKPQAIALFGARSCDIAAMQVQDKTFIDNKYQDAYYQQQRENLLIIAVNCSYSGGNCFCVSTQTGPKADTGFDLALTEIAHGFSLEIGSTRGQAIVDRLHCQAATKAQSKQAEKNITHAANMQTKRMPKNNARELRDTLMNNLQHPRWDEVAERCLSCGNCTSVCPTCFCHHETETVALDGHSSEHQREWDSCFSAGHSYIHHHTIRDDTKSRYRQWLTHKLATWWDQFDSSGCIGCGRCITWCPVGIDITEEVAAITGESHITGQNSDDHG